MSIKICRSPFTDKKCNIRKKNRITPQVTILEFYIETLHKRSKRTTFIKMRHKKISEKNRFSTSHCYNAIRTFQKSWGHVTVPRSKKFTKHWRWSKLRVLMFTYLSLFGHIPMQLHISIYQLFYHKLLYVLCIVLHCIFSNFKYKSILTRINHEITSIANV